MRCRTKRKGGGYVDAKYPAERLNSPEAPEATNDSEGTQRCQAKTNTQYKTPPTQYPPNTERTFRSTVPPYFNQRISSLVPHSLELGPRPLTPILSTSLSVFERKGKGGAGAGAGVR